MDRRLRMVEAIVLAAGSSSRAGGFKMELPLGDKTLIERSIEGMYDVCSRIVIVGGFRVERVRELLLGYSKVEVVENVNWQSGMFSSVKVGVQNMKGDRFFLLPADVPLVPEIVYRKMLSVQEEIVIPMFGDRKGHPVLFRNSVVKAILNEPNGSSLRNLIGRKGGKTLLVEHEEVILDVDMISDYNAMCRRFQKTESANVVQYK